MYFEAALDIYLAIADGTFGGQQWFAAPFPDSIFCSGSIKTVLHPITLPFLYITSLGLMDCAPSPKHPHSLPPCVQPTHTPRQSRNPGPSVCRPVELRPISSPSSISVWHIHHMPFTTPPKMPNAAASCTHKGHAHTERDKKPAEICIHYFRTPRSLNPRASPPSSRSPGSYIGRCHNCVASATVSIDHHS